jgi:hypothetical protein
MEWKFQHEHHNREAKNRKVDYREEIATARNDKPVAVFKAELDHKAEMIKDFKKALYLLRGRKLRLAWELQNYANENGLDPAKPQTKVDFNCHYATAEKDFERIREKIRHGRLHIRRAKVGFDVTLTIRTQTDCEVVRNPSKS